MDIIVENYQSIKKAKLKVEGITVLRGASNSGKSAFFRAVQSAMFNRFKSGVVRYGEDACSVKIRFDKGGDVLTVVRRNTGGSPQIKLGNNIWSKLNRDLPKEVRDFLNVGNLNVSNTEQYSLNFFSQFQPPLLAEYSSKKIMDILSASKAVDDLNIARKLIDQKRERNRGAFDQLDAAITETKVALTKSNMNLSEYLKLDEVTPKVKELEDTYKYLDSVSALKKAYLSKASHVEALNKLLNLKSLFELKDVLNAEYDNLNRLSESMEYKRRLTLKLEKCLKPLSVVLDNYNVTSLAESDLVKLKGFLSEKKSLQSANKVLHKKVHYLDLTLSLRDLVLADKNLHELVSYIVELRDRVRKQVILKNIKSYFDRLDFLKSELQSSTSEVNKLNQMQLLIQQKSLIKSALDKDKEIIEKNLCPYCLRSMDNHSH